MFNVDLNNKRQEIRSDIKTVDVGVLKILSLNNNKEFLVVSAEQNIAHVNAKTLATVDTIVGFND